MLEPVRRAKRARKIHRKPYAAYTPVRVKSMSVLQAHHDAVFGHFVWSYPYLQTRHMTYWLPFTAISIFSTLRWTSQYAVLFESPLQIANRWCVVRKVTNTHRIELQKATVAMTE